MSQAAPPPEPIIRTPSGRRPVLAVLGSGGILPAEILASAEELGRLAVDRGFRVVTGGREGVMEVVSRGARSSELWDDGSVIGVLPDYDPAAANPFVDIVVPTGLGLGRNIVVVAMADVVIAFSGGAGTLTEIGMAWRLGKPIIVLTGTGGWSEQLAGMRLDNRPRDPIMAASTATGAIQIAAGAVARRDPDPPSPFAL